MIDCTKTLFVSVSRASRHPALDIWTQTSTPSAHTYPDESPSSQQRLTFIRNWLNDQTIIHQRAHPELPILCYWTDCSWLPTPAHPDLLNHSLSLFQGKSVHWRASSGSTHPLSNPSGNLPLWHAQVSSTRPFYLWIQTCQVFAFSPPMALTGGVEKNQSQDQEHEGWASIPHKERGNRWCWRTVEVQELALIKRKEKKRKQQPQQEKNNLSVIQQASYVTIGLQLNEIS